MDWKQQYRLSWLLLAAVVIMQLFIQQGVVCQQQQLKPQIYWANDASQNVQKQQKVPITWSQSYDNHIDRDWNAAPAPAPASQSYYPQPASPAPPAAPTYAAPPPAPANYYTSPAPPPPPVYYTSPVPPPQSSYNAPASVPVPAVAPATPPATPAPHGPINYYYYWPDKPQKGVILPKPSEVFEPEKELFPDKPWLEQGQKVWIAVLTPLIVVALVVPLVAILFSGITITTTNGRSLGLFDGISNEIGDFASRYATVLESEQCIQRIICELGSYTNTFTEKTYILPFLELLVPDTMKANLAIFQKASIKGKNAECATYKCSTWSHYFQ